MAFAMTSVFDQSQPSSLQGYSDLAAPVQRRFKRSGTTRERTGCLTCRQRRKKCDSSTYPICGHCRRLNLECVREEPRPLVRVAAPYSKQRKSLNGNKEKAISSTEEDTVVATSSLVASVALPKIPESLQLAVYTGYGGANTNDRRYLLKYYTQVLTTHTTTTLENNSFLSVFLPMAMESPPLLSSIVAWSSSHLSCFQPAYRVTALEKKSAALRCVAQSLSTSDSSTQETNLAACLVLCSMEVALGDSQWYQHIVGAKHLIETAQVLRNGQMTQGPRAFMKTLDGEWLLRNFAYHDVLGAVVTGREPLIKGAYWLHDNMEIVDSYVGVASQVLFLISEISCLQVPGLDEEILINDDEISEDSDSEEESIWNRCKDLEHQLQSWVCPSAIQPGLDAMAEAWRSSALLYLYRKIRSALNSTGAAGSSLSPTPRFISISNKIDEQVESIIAQLARIPLISLPECGLLFPLFMAGGDTVNPAYIEVIRLRLRILQEHRAFRNLERASEVLEELWRLKCCGITGKGGAIIDWMDILERTGIILSLA